MDMLTVGMLDQIPENTIFAEGIDMIGNPWEPTGLLLVKWVAKRGQINDWAIYHSSSRNFNTDPWHMTEDLQFMTASPEKIADFGTKLRDWNDIQRLVPCDQDALKLYRR